MSKRQCPLLRRKNSRENPDRFIPNRSAMDFDFAHYMLTEGRNKDFPIASASAYHRKLAEALGLDRRRILAFKNKPTTPTQSFPEGFLTTFQPNKPQKPRRYIPQNSEWTLDAPDIGDDYYLNLLDWGSSNVLALAIANTVHLWDPSNGSASELVTVNEEDGPITSVSWAANGHHIAIGLNNSEVLLWDCRASRQLTTFRGGHRSRVGSLAWNKHIITSGGKDGQIINNDVRVGPSQIATTYRGHRQEVCGLKWSESGQRLASGGKDNLLHVWEKSVASSRSSRTHWLHRLEHHTAAVKALAWCPFQSNLLASGGGGLDGCIRFWNAQTGVCLNSIHTGSEVSSLLWNKYEHEILSSHGFPNNQLTLWKYPAMTKMGELLGHTSRVLLMAESPNGCTVASVSGDETLKIWNVFGTPQVAKPQPKNPEPFLHMMNRIHIR